jgi:hypothetical protein
VVTSLSGKHSLLRNCLLPVRGWACALTFLPFAKDVISSSFSTRILCTLDRKPNLAVTTRLADGYYSLQHDKVPFPFYIPPILFPHPSPILRSSFAHLSLIFSSAVCCFGKYKVSRTNPDSIINKYTFLVQFIDLDRN